MATYGLMVEGHFDAAHFLANYHGKCENLHGHRWRVEVSLAVSELASQGSEAAMVMDFSRAKREVAQACAALDHTFLYEEGTLAPATVAALEAEGFTLTPLPFRTTAENLAHHLFCVLSDRGLPVVRVEVDETPHNRAFYEPTV